MQSQVMRQRSTGQRVHRITMLLENYPYPADVRVSREARALAAAGHKVTVVAPMAPGQGRRETVDGVHVKRFPIPRQGTSALATLCEYLVAIVLLHAAAAAELLRGSTVLHLHNPPDTFFPAAMLARVLKRRVIFDHHDLFPELVEVRLGRGLWYRGALACERATFALADRVLATNESHARIARERGGVRPERVTVVRNGPPLDTIVPEPRVRPGALTDPHLVYVGLLASQDGGDLLPQLMVRLRQDHGLGEARLTVVGDGDERPRLEAALRRANLTDRAHITGWVSAAEVHELISSADICVDTAPPTALNHHSTMMKIAEYMAAGKPTVAFDLVETRWTAKGAAKLARPGDLGDMAAAVADLASDHDARLALAQHGLKRVPSLSWERSVETLLDVYARL